MSDTSWGPLLHRGVHRPRKRTGKMLFLYVIVLFIIGSLPNSVDGETGKQYKMSVICKNHFLRDLYRKIDGAVLTSQNERNLDCAITFQTHSILQRFMLRFDLLQLDCNDHLYIYDGAHAVSNFKADLSCRNTHLTVGSIYTRTNFVTLKYVTDGWGTDANGFRLVITAVKDPKHTCKDFRCTLKEFCIDDDLVCDGVNHCGDGSDELASPLCSNTEASTILGMQRTWFAVAAVFLVLSTMGLAAGAVLCYCRKRVVTPRHIQNAHNNTHAPVSFPCLALLRRSVSKILVRLHRGGKYSTFFGLIMLMIFSIAMTMLLGNKLSQSLRDNNNNNDIEENSENIFDRSKKGYQRDYFLGPCLVHSDKTCPDEEITFFMYTRNNQENGYPIIVNDTNSNLNDTFFNPKYPTKIIVHGYNSGMQLDSLVDIRNEYLKKDNHNIIAVDWHRLASAPCYPIVVQNIPHVGNCLAQLIVQLRAAGAENIHVIGFSLGAHVPAFSANTLKPYKLPRITGLDPAMPFFITVDKDHKLDKSDAEFVDVFHTNAFIQGKIETVGHIDFYMNGGINQPGCWEEKNPFGCNHHRSAVYFAESVNSKIGFWGWPCPGLLAYLIGLCPPRFPAILAGDPVDKKYTGFYLVMTKAEFPYAAGLFPVDKEDTV